MKAEPSYRLFHIIHIKGRSLTINKLLLSKCPMALWTFFILLDVCGILVVSSDSSVKSNTEVDDHFPKRNCETALPMCECYDGQGKAGLTCRNVTDFEAFHRTLNNGSVFKINTTFEITLNGSQNLPRAFLYDLIVYDLILDNPRTQRMDKLAFEGVLHLTAFTVKISSLEEIPDFGTVRDSLLNLNFENSLLTVLDGYELKHLPVLETVSFVNNTIYYVAPHAFQGTNNVAIFDISYNRLTWLPELFDSWKKLKTVRLSHNNLLHVNHLFNVTHPQLIYLDYNNLTDLDSVLHPNMIAVDTLELSHNPFSKVTVDSFNEKVNNIRFLYLGHCLIREFDVRHYQNLSYLRTLDLSQNEIENVKGQKIDFGNNVQLNLSSNKIREFNAELSYLHVDSVYLNKNFLTSLNQTLQFSQMTEASIADNRIGSLGPEDFRGVQAIQALDLQGNVITQVGRSTFAPIRKELEYLDLSRNLITSLEGCVQSLGSLLSLNLTDNLIENFEEDEFLGLNELTDLYLEGNRIATLGNELQRLATLQFLVISHNRIQTLKREQIPKNLQYLYLAGNPFKCDCELFPFLQFLNSSTTLGTDVSLCTSRDDSFPRHQAPAQCPDDCRCHCSMHAKRHFMTVNCSSTSPNQLPDLFRSFNATPVDDDSSTLVISVQRRVNKHTIFPENGLFVIEDEIGGVDISNNSLQSLDDARFPANLWNFFMSNNQLRQPPTSLLYSMTNLSKVTLSGNPWSCNCETLEFKKWIISRPKVILDADETRCSPDDREAPGLQNRTIWTLTDRDLCPSDINFYILSAFVMVCLLLVFLVCYIAYTRYHNSRATAVVDGGN